MDAEKEALKYHERPPAGKIFTGLSKPLATQTDLTLAYSPGVAGPCREIHKDVENSFRYTGRGNLVGVISNGTAVLGLGNIGPHAAKPVMEGKAVLFKKFADIDVFDLELDASDPDLFIAAVKALEPTFGGINLEDIKAPECFYIEEKLRASMSIPVFHDDQHGTAIIASAAFLNALEITERKIEATKVVFSGGGAAAIACAKLFLDLGVKPENLIMCDSHGVIYTGRDKGMNPYKARFARSTALRTLSEALQGADAFVGVSAADVVSPEMIMAMAKNPIIFALANPDPEIHPDLAHKHRPDAIIATGRSDFPNQVNNVLGFPFIFRGALDVGAKTINEAMKLAAVKAIANLAKQDVPEVVMRAYKETRGYQFGRDYLIPKPVDPRVLMHVAPAVAKAAMDSGVARRQVNMDEYRERIERILGPTRRIMRQVRNQIAEASKSRRAKPLIVLANGNDQRSIRATVQLYHENEVRIALLGKKTDICAAAAAMGLGQFEAMAEFIDPTQNAKAEAYANALFALRQRRGVTQTGARQLIQDPNYFAAMMVRSGDAAGMVSGLVEPYVQAARPVLEVLGAKPEFTLAGIYMLVLKQQLYFFADCAININPTAETLANIAITTASVAKHYTKEPLRIAMLSFSSFGSNRDPSATKVAAAVNIIKEKAPSLNVDGEMHADIAMDPELRQREFPFCNLNGPANILIFPDLGAAAIGYRLLTSMAEAEATGPILVGVNHPANILQRSSNTDDVVNMVYITASQTL